MGIMAKSELNLKDRLSRLTYIQACKLLGPEGSQLIIQGGKFEIDSIEENVYLDNDLFQLSVDGAVVTIKLMDGAQRRLHFSCNRCQTLCEHAGAAFALILEEKTVLGLARPPVKRVPAESLSEADLIIRALEEREERSKTRRMTVKSIDPQILWTDYIVTNSLSGKSYRVALRGWGRGSSYCSCPDFRKNTLGTCKHIMNVQRKMKNKFSAEIKKTPYIQKDFAIHILYGDTLQLRLLSPIKIPLEAARIIESIKGRSIKDVHVLLECIRKLEAAGHSVNLCNCNFAIDFKNILIVEFKFPQALFRMEINIVMLTKWLAMMGCIVTVYHKRFQCKDKSSIGYYALTCSKDRYKVKKNKKETTANCG